MMDDLSLNQMKVIQDAIRAEENDSALERLASIVLMVADLWLTEMIKEKEKSSGAK